MEELSQEYCLLFNAITDALEELEKIRRRLIEAQQTAEELYILRG